VKKIKSLFILLIITALAGGSYYYFSDTQGPQIKLTPSSGSISKKTNLGLTLNDELSSLANISVTVEQNGKLLQVLDTTYNEGIRSASENIDLSTLLLRDGNIKITATSTDRSVYHFGKGNTATATFNLILDSRPPTISALSNAHNLNFGGAGMIVYSISESVTKSGIQLGDHFFPGHKQPSGNYLCLFAFPYDTDSEAVPRLVAYDEAGNKGIGGFYYHLNKRKFKTDKIKISDGFLNIKMPQFQDQFPTAQTPLEVFLSVNKHLRTQNRAWLSSVASKTANTFTWNKSFLRQPNAATRATFGDLRHYIYNGKEIDQQTHLGIDLASTACARVPASNSGNVVYADFMGIYGQCIIIDHGLGLQTLYAHLSSMDVAVGDNIDRGQIIGRTGSTGLAGGDHLHFGVIISGVPVNPIEWWDKNWVKNNITSKLQLGNLHQ